MNKGIKNNNQRMNDQKANNGSNQSNANQGNNEASSARTFVLKKNGKDFVQNSAVDGGSNNQMKKSPNSSDILSKIIPKSYISIYIKGQDEVYN